MLLGIFFVILAVIMIYWMIEVQSNQNRNQRINPDGGNQQEGRNPKIVLFIKGMIGIFLAVGLYLILGSPSIVKEFMATFSIPTWASIFF